MLCNVEKRLHRCCAKLIQSFFNVGHRLWKRWKSKFRFCFIFNIGSTLFKRWSTTLKQRWNDVDPTQKFWLGVFQKHGSFILIEQINYFKSSEWMTGYIFWDYVLGYLWCCRNILTLISVIITDILLIYGRMDSKYAFEKDILKLFLCRYCLLSKNLSYWYNSFIVTLSR